MLRRRTSSPETLLYARESPAGAGPSWCTRTSLVAQTAGHASVAEVAHEAVARARLIPEDVRLVMAKVVAGYGVVHGLRLLFFEVRVRRDYDPARDTGGARGDVAREVVARKLHATRRAKKRDADPREIPVEFRGSTRASIVLDRVTSHLEATYVFIKLVSFEEHASAVVADRVSGDGASFSYVADVHAPRAARDVVGEHLGAGRVIDEHAEPVAYEIIPRDSRIEASVDSLDREMAFGDASDDIVHDRVAGTVPHKDANFGFRAAYNMVLRD